MLTCRWPSAAFHLRMGARCQYHTNALARVRDEQVQQLTATVEDFYKSVQQCLRHVAGLPIRPARERLFGLVLSVATKRAQEEQQV